MKSKCIALFSILFFLINCTNPENKPLTLYNNNCGSCHLPPSPEDLTKTIWESSILPEMGARLGIPKPGKETMQEQLVRINLPNHYPNAPLISTEDWKAISDYVLEHAPERIIDPYVRRNRNQNLDQFEPIPIGYDNQSGSFITSIKFDTLSDQFIIGNVRGEIFALNKKLKTIKIGQFNSPITDVSPINNYSFVTQIGIMPPSEKKMGQLSMVTNDTTQIILKQLHRPVHTLVHDLNQDGHEELVICEYGNYSGQLSLLKNNEKNTYKKIILHPSAGFIRTVAADMNSDGMKDIIAVAGQGNEGVFIFFQKENLNFEVKQVIQLNPVYGTSWMEVVDYEGDGDLDLILVQGDNADYSYLKKPYHGVRIFINDGANTFNESFFYPIYGATRVIAFDFDQDNDLDLAVSSFFPDFEDNSEESFVYLENIDAPSFQFESYIFPKAKSGSWLVAEAGDFDADGDMDILLGSFTQTAAPKPASVNLEWLNNGVDLLLLRNLLND